MKKEEKSSSKCSICGRPIHKESKYCIFHAGAEEKTEEEFKKALKEYIEKIEENNLDYNFLEFIFVGKIDFKEEFKLNTFKHVNFMKATFEDEVTFRNTTFEGNTSFNWATFKSYVRFLDTTFKSYVSFDDTIFKKYVDFGGTTFEGIAGFINVTFNDDALFEDAIFKGEASFEKAIFKKNVHFSWAKFPPGKLLSLTVKGRGNIFFEQTFLEDIILNLELGKETFIDFKNATLRNTRIKLEEIGGHILHEHEKIFPDAKEIYLLLKNNFHSIGKYEEESWAFKKEKDMERLSYSFYSFKKDLVKKKKREIFPILKWMYTKDFKKWIISVFSNMIYGYGERPWNVVKTALAIIIIFALSFSLIGIGTPEIIELKGTGIYQNSGNIVDLASKGFLKNNEIRNFPDCLYFSLITFTTLGYGDFRPLGGLGRILAGSEAFIGAFMMALFVYTFARRTGGR